MDFFIAKYVLLYTSVQATHLYITFNIQQLFDSFLILLFFSSFENYKNSSQSNFPSPNAGTIIRDDFELFYRTSTNKKDRAANTHERTLYIIASNFFNCNRKTSRNR